MKPQRIKSTLAIKYNPGHPAHKVARNYKRAMKGICGALSWKSFAQQIAAFEQQALIAKAK